MAGFYLFKYSLYSLIFIGIAVCGMLFGKYLETAFLFISFVALRYCFPKTFHHKNVYWCVFWSIAIFLIGLHNVLPIGISIFSSVLIGCVMTYVLFKIEDYIDCKIIIAKYENRNLWQMEENELADYCYAKGIRGDMLEFVIMVIIYQMKYEEIGKKLGYSVDTLKDWSPKCKAKLGIKSWKHE